MNSVFVWKGEYGITYSIWLLLLSDSGIEEQDKDKF